MKIHKEFASSKRISFRYVIEYVFFPLPISYPLFLDIILEFLRYVSKEKEWNKSDANIRYKSFEEAKMHHAMPVTYSR